MIRRRLDGIESRVLRLEAFRAATDYRPPPMIVRRIIAPDGTLERTLRRDAGAEVWQVVDPVTLEPVAEVRGEPKAIL